MFVEYSAFKTFPERVSQLTRSRYVDYCVDLHERYRVEVDPETFKGSHYQLHELAYPLLYAFKQDVATAIQWLALSYWSHEFDPDYAAFALHLVDEFQLRCKLMDVIDQGSMCALTQLFLLKELHDREQTLASIGICIDQKKVVTVKRNTLPSPSIDAATLLMFSTFKTPASSIEVIKVILFTEHQLLKCCFDIIKQIKLLLDDCQLAADDCSIFLKSSTTLYKALVFYQQHYQALFKCEINLLPLSYGCTGLFQFIHAIKTGTLQTHRKIILYLEEDLESFNAGLVILKIG